MLLSSAWADRKVPILQHFFISPTYNLLQPNFARSYPVIFHHFHFLERNLIFNPRPLSFAFNLAEASFPVNLQSPTQLCALLLCHFHSRKVLLMLKVTLRNLFFHGKVTSNKTKTPTHLFPQNHDLRLNYTPPFARLLTLFFVLTLLLSSKHYTYVNTVKH